MNSQIAVLYQNGIVTQVSGKTARVEFFRSGICGGCVGDQGCGLGPILAMFNRSRPHSMEFDMDAIPAEIRAGDAVRIAIAGQQFLKVVSLAYLTPLLGMFTGAWLAATMVPAAGDVSAVVGAMTGVLCVSQLLARSTMAKMDEYLRSARLESAESSTG
jgi:positive regulator of sigma E activity